MEQLDIFGLMYEKKELKDIHLIELFAGYGSQALALKYLGVQFKHHKICEWAVKSIQAYNDLHIQDYTNYSKDIEDKDMADILFNKGISMDYNQPMTLEQIKRKGIQWQRNVYNNIIATHNLVDISRVHAADLEIRGGQDHIMTYSFPCQDLSLAGLGKGMGRDSGTRSGLLWQVERILLECKELGTMPTVLLMENVPEVCGTNNQQQFSEWCSQLTRLGYHNTMAILNAKDFGIPQNRRRCFMLSIYGEYAFTMPTEMKLEYKLKDLLEKNVDEKYYLSGKQISEIQKWNAYEKPLENMENIDRNNISPTLTTRTSAYAAGMILIKDNLKQELCDKLIENNMVEEGDVIRHSYTHNRLDNGIDNMGRTQNKDNRLAPTLDTRCDCLGVVVKTNEEDYMGTYQYAKSDNFMQGKERLQKGKEVADTLQTNGKEGIIYSNLRIRKLTPRECFRLMGVLDEDSDKIKQSDASMYHLAGDSIVSTCLMAIFGKLLCIDYESKIKELTRGMVNND